MTFHLRHDCAHNCSECELAAPETCAEFAEMTKLDHHVRYCRDCGELAEHRVSRLLNGDDDAHVVDVYICPRCRRVFG